MAATTRMIRVSRNVKTVIKQRAQQSGLTVSEWVRQVVSRQVATVQSQFQS